MTALIAPSRQLPGRYELAMLRVFHGLCRLRPRTNVVVDRYLDAASMERPDAPVLAEHCSTPLPVFRTEVNVIGELRTDLLGSSAGQKSRGWLPTRRLTMHVLPPPAAALGRSLEDFEPYRVRIEYPLVDTTISALIEAEL